MQFLQFNKHAMIIVITKNTPGQSLVSIIARIIVNKNRTPSIPIDINILGPKFTLKNGLIKIMLITL